MNSHDLKALEDFLNKARPQHSEEVWTFLDIAGFPRYENVISNIYAYYLDKENLHGFDDLFIQALFATIKSKAKGSLKSKLDFLNNWNEWEVTREVYVDRKRIDILLTETTEDEDRIVIIENKIYHTIDNPFDTYLSVNNTKKKVGVLLSLFDEPRGHSDFINITHSEYLEEIKRLQGQYLEASEARDLFILKDLIISLNYEAMQDKQNPEILKFYAEYKQSINEVVKLRDEAINSILNKVQQIGESRKAIKVVGKKAKDSRSFRFGKSENIELYFNIDEDLQNKHFHVTLYVYNVLKEKYESLPKNDAKRKSFNKLVNNKGMIEEKDSGDNWVGVTTKPYSFEDINYDLNELNQVIDQWIEVIYELQRMLEG